jgi:methyl-accepting chemotaxis protein
MGDAFGDMIEYLQENAAVARRIAEGDLTVDVHPRSERDVLGTAFVQMSDSLRLTIGDVGRTASTLSAASQQMATTSEEAGRAVAEIASAVSDVAQGAERQARTTSPPAR